MFDQIVKSIKQNYDYKLEKNANKDKNYYATIKIFHFHKKTLLIVLNLILIDHN